MNAKGHIKTAFALSPLMLYHIPYIHSNIYLANNIIYKYNLFSMGLLNFIKNTAYQYNYLNILLIGIGIMIYFFGALFPDYDFLLRYLYNDKKKQKRYLYHRQFTHGLFLWFILFYLTLKYFNIHSIINFYIVLFILGVITHLIADMLTGTVPLWLYGKYYNTFSRIGITMFFKNKKNNPSKMNNFFVNKMPKFYDKCIFLYIIIFISLIILVK